MGGQCTGIGPGCEGPSQEGGAASAQDAQDSVNSFRLPPGAMIVLDSGRYLHRVTPVIGPHKRWTACSFMARSRARDATYCWG